MNTVHLSVSHLSCDCGGTFFFVYLVFLCVVCFHLYLSYDVAIILWLTSCHKNDKVRSNNIYSPIMDYYTII